MGRMADCFVSRCSHERRFFRKELQRWSKNVLFLVGLERVAEELAGVRRWKKLMEPFTALESETTQDWIPEEVCCFCNNKKQPPYDPASGVVHPVETLSVDTDELSCSYDQDPSPVASVPSPSCASPWQSCDPLCPPSSSSPTPVDQPLDLSLSTRKRASEPCNNKTAYCATYSGGVADSNRDTDCLLQSGASGSLNAVLKVPKISMKSCTQKRRYDPNCKRSYTEEELQAALRDIQSGKLGTRRAAVIYGIPRSTLRNKVYKMAHEKNLGKRKLVAVKNDMKVGAARPAKDGEEEDGVDHSAADTQVTDAGNVNLQTPSASGSLRQLLKNTITQRGQQQHTFSKKGDGEGTNCRGSSVPTFGNAEAMTAIQLLSSTLECNQSLMPLFSHLFGNIHQLALTQCKGGSPLVSQKQVADAKNEVKLPLIVELIHRLAEEKLEEECHQRRSMNGCLLSECSERTGTSALVANEENIDGGPDLPPFGGTSSGSSSSVILKVPSYKPVVKLSATSTNTSGITTLGNTPSAAKTSTSCSSTKNETQGCDKTSVTLAALEGSSCTVSSISSSHVVINSGSSEAKAVSASAKDLVTKNVAQKVSLVSAGGSIFEGCALGGVSSAANSSSNNSICIGEGDSTSGSSDISLSTNATKEALLESLPGSKSPSKPEKRTRPKRGRYRNYDRDDLAEAVRAVQRGEMSVHRAGNYYGVPHSTLEYKVKERHLLRQRKRESCIDTSTAAAAVSSKTAATTTITANATTSIDGGNSAQSSAKNLAKASEDEAGIKNRLAGSQQINGSLVHQGGGGSVASLPSHFSLWQTMPFFPIDFSQVGPNSFFASNMMRKLQENARLHEEAQKSQKQNEDTSILENLIKSTLERSLSEERQHQHHHTSLSLLMSAESAAKKLASVSSQGNMAAASSKEK